MKKLIKKTFVNLSNYTFILLSAGVRHRFKYKGNSIENPLLVLANGPSLKQELANHLQFFENKDLLVVNDFAYSPYYEELKPKFYVFLDPVYFLPDERLPDEYRNEKNKLTKLLFEKTTWDMTIFTNYRYSKSKIVNILTQNVHIHFQYYNINSTVSGIVKITESNSTVKILKNGYIMLGQNVSCTALCFALNYGYKNILLFGADHSWTEDMRVNDQNQLCLIKKHFYDNVVDYIPWMDSNGNVMKISSICGCFSRAFRQHEIINWYAKIIGAKITNYTHNSYIDSYDRKYIPD